MDDLRKKIAECVLLYRKDLASLQKSFQKPILIENESPFDPNSFKLHAPIFSSFETEQKVAPNESPISEEPSQTFILSDNDDTIKN